MALRLVEGLRQRFAQRNRLQGRACVKRRWMQCFARFLPT
jgi:hypothetical protein